MGFISATPRFLKRMLAVSAFLTLTPATAFAQDAVAPQFQEWSAETRTSLAFRVNADAACTLLPPGWTVAASAENPEQVALSVTFMDRHVVLDAEGKPVGSGSSRYMVMSVVASNETTGQRGVMIINGISPEGSGSYEVYQPAATARAERSVVGLGLQQSRVQEVWEMVSDSGDSVTLNLGYRQGVPVRQQSRIVIRSGSNTGFTRTYQIDQTNDALGLPGAADTRIEFLDFRAQGPLYSRLFDGTEVLTAVTSTPWYHRDIFIP